MNIPVILFFYNRPAKLRRVIKIIKSLNFKKLYFFSDGPKNKADKKNVEKCRYLVEKYFPNAEIFKYSKNIGFGYRIVENIKSVLKKEGKAIILEDDIIFNKKFIDACGAFLAFHTKDKNNFCFKGYNHLLDIEKECYLKTNIFLPPWGWAVNRDAFKYVTNFGSKSYGIFFKFKQLKEKFKNSILLKYIENCEKNINALSWDNHVFLSILFYNLHVILPSKNLVKNIGYDKQASQTRNKNSLFYNNTVKDTFNEKTKVFKDFSNINTSKTIEFFKDTCRTF